MDMSASVHHPFLSQVLSYGVKVNPTGLWRSGGVLAASISGPWHHTRQRIRASLCKHGGDWGIVLAGKQSEAGGWDSQRSVTPTIHLGRYGRRSQALFMAAPWNAWYDEAIQCPADLPLNSAWLLCSMRSGWSYDVL